MKQKAFFIIVKGLSMKQIKQFSLESEGPTLNFLSEKLTFPTSFEKVSFSQ